MISFMPEAAYQALEDARDALNRGNLQKARRLTLEAINLAPEYEAPWLYLASVSSPRASIVYLKKALEINPSSTQAKKGLHWAIQRFRLSDSPPRKKQLRVPISISKEDLLSRSPAFLPWPIISLIVVTVMMAWLWTPDFSFAFPNPQSTPQINLSAQDNVQKVTYTPTPTFTPTPTTTPTATPTHTITPTPEPTKRPSTSSTSIQPILPPGVYPDERWIDVNLTTQRVTAYDGDKAVKTFVVSTGLPGTPTVTGRFRVYVKYVSTLMTGPGYYLPNVPYTMYFYFGYGIHGTYWHNNFGTPMSHGCVNMKTSDAEWLFNWSSVGTLINSHY
jgi:lipoprotein-anchoring transpeptidase ErfK/SrfK